MINFKIPSSMVPEKVRRRRLWNFFKRSFWILIVFILLLELYRLNGFLSSTSASQIEKSNAQVENLNNQLNELREYLLLPTEEDQEAEDLSLSNQLGQILKEYNQEKNSELQLQILREELDKGLKLEEVEEIDASSAYRLEDDGEIYTILSATEVVLTFGIENKKLFILSPDKRYEFTSSQAVDFATTLQPLITIDSLDKIKSKNEIVQNKVAEINNLKNIATVKALLTTKELTQNPVQKKSDNYVATINSTEGQTVATISYRPSDNSFSLLDDANKLISERTESLTILQSALETYLRANSFESILEQNIKSKVKEVQSAVDAPEFYEALQKANLTYAVEEEESQFVFNFIDRDKKTTVFQIAIDKTDGSVYLQKGETKKKLNFQTSNQIAFTESGKNFLIAGKHGKLTDTIILMNLKEDSKKATLVSIPRDLYTDGEKINAIYAKKGMPGLVDKVEEITGMPIENYVLIDMYAFIDVVDYLGGINVFLSEEVVDPTYRTFDDGVWGTMYFAAGEHHLTGTQALRLARSRNYSSDFARAERQHLILQALRDKSTELGFTDAQTIMKIAYTLLDKTETDLQPSKAVRYFFKYKSYDIAGQNVLSTANVLTSTYSNDYLGRCENCPRGAYILIPKNDDWSLIRTYVRNAISRK